MTGTNPITQTASTRDLALPRSGPPSAGPTVADAKATYDDALRAERRARRALSAAIKNEREHLDTEQRERIWAAQKTAAKFTDLLALVAWFMDSVPDAALPDVDWREDFGQMTAWCGGTGRRLGDGNQDRETLLNYAVQTVYEEEARYRAVSRRAQGIAP